MVAVRNETPPPGWLQVWLLGRLFSYVRKPTEGTSLSGYDVSSGYNQTGSPLSVRTATRPSGCPCGCGNVYLLFLTHDINCAAQYHASGPMIVINAELQEFLLFGPRRRLGVFLRIQLKLLNLG